MPNEPANAEPVRIALKPPDGGRHVRAFTFDVEAFGRWFRTGNVLPRTEVLDGVPADAVLLRAWVDPQTGTLRLVFEHPLFPLVDFGQIIPDRPVMFRTLRPGDPNPQPPTP